MVSIAGYEITMTDDPFQGIGLNIYCAGCKRRCAGCHNPELQSAKAGKLTDELDVMAEISKRSNLIGSVIFVGGDWINYQRELKYLSKQCDLRFNLRTILYTGEKFENIPKDVLEHISVIIDGEYDKTCPSNFIIPASLNQRVFVSLNLKDGSRTHESVHLPSLPINQESVQC